MMPSRQLLNVDRKFAHNIQRLLCMLYDLKLIDDKIAVEFMVGPYHMLRTFGTSSTGGR